MKSPASSRAATKEHMQHAAAPLPLVRRCITTDLQRGVNTYRWPGRPMGLHRLPQHSLIRQRDPSCCSMQGMHAQPAWGGNTSQSGWITVVVLVSSTHSEAGWGSMCGLHPGTYLCSQHELLLVTAVGSKAGLQLLRLQALPAITHGLRPILHARRKFV